MGKSDNYHQTHRKQRGNYDDQPPYHSEDHREYQRQGNVRAPDNSTDALYRGPFKENQPGSSAQGGTGTVKWFNVTKGFGFIQPDSGGADVFVHITAVERAGLKSIADGARIAYDLETGRRDKTCAINLRLLP